MRDRFLLLAVMGSASMACGAIVPSHVEAQVTPPPRRDVDLSRPAGTTCTPPDCYSSLVDEQAKLVPGTALLTYPDSLRATGVSARVTVHFIVDTTGQVRPHSVQFVETPNQLFSVAALRALAGARFTAAKFHGRLVSQAMTWTLEFRPSVSGSAPAQLSEPQPLVQPAPAAGTYFEFKIDKNAAPLPGNPSPQYPDTLRSMNVQGEVVAEFVVDTMGHVDTTTVRILRSTHELFTNSVRAVLPMLRFSPAEVGRRKVKQRVQMPFQFNVQRETKASKPPLPDLATCRRMGPTHSARTLSETPCASLRDSLPSSSPPQ